ncbi:MAG: DUF5683 domain-containing protein [Flavobacteriaceae bacterium]|nr:DUF5683 domain-containing protein [Flavobacteriaceae bacterium]
MALLILLLLTGSLYSQVLEEDIRMIGDSIQNTEEIDVLSPSRAAFYSAILPGLGQAYNRKYWKIPIVYGAIGTGLYFVKWNADELDRYETAYKQRLAGQEDEFDGEDGNPFISTDGLVRAQNVYKKNRDLSMFITLGLYALNIIEANVDAHLDDKAFNKNLSLRPSFYYDPLIGNTVAGVYLKYDFDY